MAIFKRGGNSSLKRAMHTSSAKQGFHKKTWRHRCIRKLAIVPQKGNDSVEAFYSNNLVPQQKDSGFLKRKSKESSSASLEFAKPIAYDRSIPKGAYQPLSSSILQRIAAGDSAAVQDCLNRYGGLVWSLAKRYNPDPQETEDAVQEIFIELWKKAHLFDENLSQEKTFIAMLARRRLIDRLRRSYRKPNMEPIENSFDLEAEGTVDSIRQIDGKRAFAAFSGLKPEQRKCLRLSIMVGLSHSEISEVVALPIGTVKSHIRRGLIAVKEQVVGKGHNLAQGRST